MPNFHNWRKINSTIFKQETIESWFSGVSTSVNNEVIQPFQNASSVIDKYNQAIQNNSLTQQGWERLLAQSDDSLKAYLTSVKGSTASMTAYNVSLQGSITGFSKVSSAVQQYNALGAISKKEQQEFATAVGLTNNKLGSYLIGLNGSNASLRGYGVSLVASTAKTIGLTVATTALNAAMTMGISVIVTGLISAFTAWINKSEEITEKAQEAADKINSISESLKTNTETVENAKRRYAELAQEVENLGKITQSQGTLDNEEYEEFLDLSNQLAGVFPSLTKNYDENGNAILDLSGDVNTIVGSLDDLIQKEKELANQQIMEKFPDVFKGYAQDVSEAESKVKSAQTEFDKINNAYQQLATHGSSSLAFDTTQTGEPFATFKNEIGEDVTIGINEYTQALDELGIAYKKSNLWKPNQFGGKDLVGTLIEATGDIDEAFTSKLETARNNLQYAQEQLEGQTSSIDSYLNTWLQSEYTYNKIEDDGLKTAIQNLVFDFDWDNLPDGVNEDNWTEVSEYLRRNILFAISKVQNDPTISKALSEVFTNDDLTPDEKINYIKQIQDYFGEDNAITISLATQLEDNSPLQTLHKQYDSAIEQTKKQFKGDTSAATEALKTAQENLQDEYDKIEKWGLGDYAEQIKNGTIQSVFGNVDMDNRQVIDWTTDNIEKWKDALSDIKYYDEDGNFLDSYYDQLKESAENGESCIDTVFGDMMDYIEGYDGITALSFSHIVNNDDGTFEFLGQKTAEEYLYGILDAAKQDGDMSIDHILELDKKGLENAEVYDAEGKLIGQTYIHGIISGFNENANDISMLTHFAGDFGAVNLAKQAIEDAKKMQEDFDWDSWFKENSINTKEEIDNWLEIAQAANSAAEARKRYVQGSTLDNETTILSISKTVDQLNTQLKPAMDSLAKAWDDVFDNEGKIRIDKTNLLSVANSIKSELDELADPKGLNLKVDYSTYEDFIRVLEDTESTESEVKDAFDSLAQYIIDVSVNGAENFETLKRSLSDLGIVNNEIVALDKLINNIEALKEAGLDLAVATENDIQKFVVANVSAQNYTEALNLLKIQKILCNGTWINSSKDIQELSELASATGIVSDALSKLYTLQIGYNTVTDEAAKRAISAQMHNLKAEVEAEFAKLGEAKFDGSIINNSSTSKTETDWSNLLDKETKLLEKQLAANVITFQEYIAKRKDIIDSYYKQGLISAEEYYSALEDMYNHQLSLYDGVIDAVTDVIDKQIDDFEKEKKSIEEVYNLKIKSIQTEIDSLQKAREEREKQVELEKALYEVEKLRNQRDIKLYSGNDRGVIYTNDSKALREAEENLEDTKYELHISKLERQIESLEQELNNATEAIDKQIEKLEDYKDKWNEIGNEYTRVHNDILAKQILGANYEQDILNQRMAVLEVFKNDYISAQEEMANAAWRVYEAQSAIGHNNNPSTNVDTPTRTEKTSTPQWYIVDSKNEHEILSSGFSSQKELQEELKKRGQYYTQNASSNKFTIKKFASGGIINSKENILTSLAKSIGEDTIIAAENGERILTPVQNELWEKWTDALPNLQNLSDVMLHIKPIDFYQFGKFARKDNNQQSNVTIGEIHLHEVQNVKDFGKELEKNLPNISIQFRNK